MPVLQANTIFSIFVHVKACTKELQCYVCDDCPEPFNEDESLLRDCNADETNEIDDGTSTTIDFRRTTTDSIVTISN